MSQKRLPLMRMKLKQEELQIEDDSAEYEESPRKKLNTSLESVGVSPINVHAVPQHSRPTRAK